MRLVLVLVGGALGSGSRYLVSTWMADRYGAAFPWGTLTVNVVGSFVIGLLATLADETGFIGAESRVLLVVGVLGGFTTFSSFALDSLRLVEVHELLRAGLYVAGTMAVSFMAVTGGVALARGLSR